MNKVNAIFFDLDETLIENRLSVRDVFTRTYTDFETELGDTKQKAFFTELSIRAKRLWSTMFDTDESPEHQLVNCFRHSIIATDSVAEYRHLSLAQDMVDHFIALSAGNVHFQDSAEAVLAELNKLGYVVGLITNGIEQVQMSKIEKLNIADKVDHITISAQARAHKPAKAVFDLALERAAIPADQACMIGDHPTNDVAGGIRAGLTGIYYNPKRHQVNSTFSELEETPDHTIERLADVLGLLEQ